MIRVVLESLPRVKRTLGRSWLRWNEQIGKDIRVMEVEPVYTPRPRF